MVKNRKSTKSITSKTSVFTVNPNTDHIPIKTEEKSECNICLGEPDEKGLLKCTHSFCYDCILSWSKRENTCPLCKERFTSIEKVSKGNSVKSKKKRKVTVKSKSQGDDYQHLHMPFHFGIGMGHHFIFRHTMPLFPPFPFGGFDEYDDDEDEDYDNDEYTRSPEFHMEQILSHTFRNVNNNLSSSSSSSSSTSRSVVNVIDDDDEDDDEEEYDDNNNNNNSSNNNHHHQDRSNRNERIGLRSQPFRLLHSIGSDGSSSISTSHGRPQVIDLTNDNDDGNEGHGDIADLVPIIPSSSSSSSSFGQGSIVQITNDHDVFMSQGNSNSVDNSNTSNSSLSRNHRRNKRPHDE